MTEHSSSLIAINGSEVAKQQFAALLTIEPVRSLWIRRMVNITLLLMLMIIPVIALPTNPLRIPGQLMFASGFLGATLALAAFRTLMTKVARILVILWRRGVVTGSSNAGRQVGELSTFARDTEASLNSPYQWITAISFVLLVLYWNWSSFGSHVLVDGILTLGVILEIEIAVVVGLMAWRMLIVGYRVWLLPRRFELYVHGGHPDQCGGLGPLGDLCLWNALILAIAGVFLGSWSTLGLTTSYRVIAQAYATLFQSLLVVPLVVSFTGFLLPLWSIHEGMLQCKVEVDSQLDELSQDMAGEDKRLLTSARAMDPTEIEKRTSQLESFRRVYDQYQRMPTWPVNTVTITKFLASQSVPLLSFVGVSQPIVTWVSAITSGFRH